ncbi:MAG: hypothetical protein E7374_03280 [Clostridiales bacterium]|nr:hypothetical protein [Clostridiales bacterium]
MTTRKFDFHASNIPLLKRDMITRLIFTFLFLGVFFYQFTVLFIDYLHDKVGLLKISVGIVLLFLSMMFCLLSFLYAYKDMKIMNKVKKNKVHTTNVAILFPPKSQKTAKFYLIVQEILSIIALLGFVWYLTYSILEYAYNHTYTFYLPLIAFIALTGFNTVYHIRNEMKILDQVQEHSNI